MFCCPLQNYARHCKAIPLIGRLQSAFQVAELNLGSFETGKNAKKFELAASTAARHDASMLFIEFSLTETECLQSIDDRNNLLPKLCHELQVRLDDIEQNPISSSMKLLDMRFWPQTDDRLRNFGSDELKAGIEHFRKVLHDRVALMLCCPNG
jgi:hypothetical protein